MSVILQTVVTAAPHDPFKGVVPDFTIFGADFNAWWKKLLAGVPPLDVASNLGVPLPTLCRWIPASTHP